MESTRSSVETAHRTHGVTAVALAKLEKLVINIGHKADSALARSNHNAVILTGEKGTNGLVSNVTEIRNDVKYIKNTSEKSKKEKLGFWSAVICTIIATGGTVIVNIVPKSL